MLNPLCKIQEETILIGKLPVRLFRVININELFDELVTKDPESLEVKDERIPYWADLWPSSIALCHYMIDQKVLQPGMKTLEIGCGLGLPGVVAGMMGSEVTFTDYMPEPLELARRNWELNNEHPASFKLLDWRNELEEISEDVILASDVAYESRMFKPLMEFVVKVCAQGRTILLSEPGRKLSKPFLEQVADQGLVKEVRQYIIPLNNIDTCVTVYKLRESP